jgi:hypothetical protein
MVLSSMPEAVAGGAKHGATWREYMAIMFWWQPAVVLCSCGGGVGGGWRGCQVRQAESFAYHLCFSMCQVYVCRTCCHGVSEA